MAKHVFVFHFESDKTVYEEQPRLIAALHRVMMDVTGESPEGTSATLDHPLTKYASDKLLPFMHKGA